MEKIISPKSFTIKFEASHDGTKWMTLNGGEVDEAVKAIGQLNNGSDNCDN